MIKGFRAVRYNPQHPAIEPEKVIAPPYDVINDQLKEELYKQSPYNCVRLILGKEEEGDNQQNNVYTRAKNYWINFLEKQALIYEDKSSIYPIRQSYIDLFTGEKRIRNGFIGLIKACDFNEKIIFPHEKTFKGPKEDRLKLWKETQAQLSQVFLLYHDSNLYVESLFKKILDPSKPIFSGKGSDGVLNQMWKLDDHECIESLQGFFKNGPFLIADGHHRYETSLSFRDWAEKNNKFEGRAKDLLVFFVNMQDPGLAVYPTHRLIKDLKNFNWQSCLNKLEKDFSIKELGNWGKTEFEDFKNVQAKKPSKDHGFFIFFKDKSKIRGFEIKIPIEKAKEKLNSLNNAEVYKELDVVTLHQMILPIIGDCPPEYLEKNSHVRYFKTASAAYTDFLKNHSNCLILMDAIPLPLVLEACRLGERMPQKSTFFYPKIPSGLVFRDLNKD